MDRTVDIVAIGHAIVDVVAPTDDALVASFGLTKGTMTLVDDERSERIYGALGPATASSGGSAANTAAGLASLGVRVAFAGKVGDDDLGRVFSDDIRAAGVDFSISAAEGGPGTGRCVIMVTPDAERTMCTSLGVSDRLDPEDLNAGQIARAQVLYIEGYLCGLEATEATIEAALAAAAEGGTQVALSLSDPSWVSSHREALAQVLGHADLVFANEAEALDMTGAADVEEAVVALAGRCPTVVVTRSAAGAVVGVAAKASAGASAGAPAGAAGDVAVFRVAAEHVGRVVDTTGAGDLFAAGYLHGHVRGYGPERSARLGALSAAEVVSHFGARPQVPLVALAAGAGLLA
ncbi:MAG TPA: adenosine kinase [Acidimicrobiales bacterium]|nr:adenosine kinase [Acidimicrobiales bacterium]